MARRRIWAFVGLASAGMVVTVLWLYGRPPFRFIAGAKLQETILAESLSHWGMGASAGHPPTTFRIYELTGDVHKVAWKACEELVSQDWEAQPRFYYLSPLEPRFLEPSYGFVPGDPAMRDRFIIVISRSWDGRGFIEMQSPTTTLDRIAHFLGRR